MLELFFIILLTLLFSFFSVDLKEIFIGKNYLNIIEANIVKNFVPIARKIFLQLQICSNDSQQNLLFRLHHFTTNMILVHLYFLFKILYVSVI